MKHPKNELAKYIESIVGYYDCELIAEETGFAKGTINKWTRGDRGITRINDLIDFADYLSSKDYNPPSYHILKILGMRVEYEMVIDKWVHNHKWGKL